MLTAEMKTRLLEGRTSEVVRLKADGIRITLRNHAGRGYALEVEFMLGEEPLTKIFSPCIEVDDNFVIGDLEVYTPLSVS